MSIKAMTIERAIDNAIASTEMEGFVITNEQKSLIERLMHGDISLNDALKTINRKYK